MLASGVVPFDAHRTTHPARRVKQKRTCENVQFRKPLQMRILSRVLVGVSARWIREKHAKIDPARRFCVGVAMHLANDIARCDGVSYEEDGQTYWREGCELCLRRLAPRPERVSMIAPPAIIAFQCEFLIEPRDL